MRTSSHATLSALLLALLAPSSAHAFSSYLNSFNATYGTSQTRLDNCNTCHGATTSTWNPYGTDLRARISSGIDAALTAVETLYSDMDGFSNLTEIQALTFPGDPSDKPVAAPPACPDADGDGYAVCDGTCVPPTGTTCGDCNDSNAAVNPGAVEGPFGNATCSDAMDNDCNGAVDSADAACAPLPSDYDIQAFAVPATAVVRQPITLSVTLKNNGTTNPGGSITVYGKVGRKTIAVTSSQTFQVPAGGTATLTFAVTPRATGTITWFASVTDGDPDVDEATATTVVSRK